MNDELYSIKEVANLRHVEPQTVRNWIKEGIKGKKLQGKKIGRNFIISRSELEKFTSLEKPHEVQPDIELINKSLKNIHILGTNALGPLHEGYEGIKNALNRGVDVKVLLLDPQSEAFEKREFKEDNIRGKIFPRLHAELIASIMICVELNHSGVEHPNVGKLELRFYNEDPTKSLIIIDPESEEGILKEKIYPDKLLTRGQEGNRRMLFPRFPDSEEFNDIAKSFDKLWESAKRVDLDMKYNTIEECFKSLWKSAKSKGSAMNKDTPA